MKWRFLEKKCSEVEISREKGSEVEMSREKCCEVEISGKEVLRSRDF